MRAATCFNQQTLFNLNLQTKLTLAIVKSQLPSTLRDKSSKATGTSQSCAGGGFAYVGNNLRLIASRTVRPSPCGASGPPGGGAFTSALSTSSVVPPTLPDTVPEDEEDERESGMVGTLVPTLVPGPLVTLAVTVAVELLLIDGRVISGDRGSKPSTGKDTSSSSSDFPLECEVLAPEDLRDDFFSPPWASMREMMDELFSIPAAARRDLMDVERMRSRVCPCAEEDDEWWRERGRGEGASGKATKDSQYEFKSSYNCSIVPYIRGRLAASLKKHDDSCVTWMRMHQISNCSRSSFVTAGNFYLQTP